MSAVCREFGISRKTGCKIFDRYRQEGVEALTGRSRRPVRYANQLLERPGGGVPWRLTQPDYIPIESEKIFTP